MPTKNQCLCSQPGNVIPDCWTMLDGFRENDRRDVTAAWEPGIFVRKGETFCPLQTRPGRLVMRLQPNDKVAQWVFPISIIMQRTRPCCQKCSQGRTGDLEGPDGSSFSELLTFESVSPRSAQDGVVPSNPEKHPRTWLGSKIINRIPAAIYGG